MSEAVGIHRHKRYKTGARPNDPDRPRISYKAIRAPGASILSGPIVPTAVDDTLGVTYGLDNNDKFGVCVPTAFDNFMRTLTRIFNGTQVSADWDQIVRWYREQNPNFNPDTGAGDGGMNIQEFLEARVKDGTIIAFASVDSSDEDLVKEACWLFLGLIIGVDLQTAQQSQTNTGTWNYQRSGEWGGHCALEPAFEEEYQDAISWAIRVRMARKFIAVQRTEVWVVITKFHTDHPTFRQGIDLEALKSEFNKITGRTLDIPPAPTPAPNPDPAPPTPTNDEVDQALWTLASDWVLHHRHSEEAADVAKALKGWAFAKGLTG